MQTFLSAAAMMATLLGVCGNAMASAQLAEEKQCMQCHAVDKRVIGPSFQSIAAIYRRMDDPEAKLAAVIHHGSGAYLGPLSGAARMPDDSERPSISQEETRQLARWILSQ